MAGEQTTYKKLILVQADTSGLQNLAGDTARAQQVLNQLGVGTEQVSEVTKKATTATSTFGKITTSSMYQVKTASGETYNLMVKEGAKATAGMGDFERAMRRVAIVVPMWYLFRTVFMLVIRTISEGMKYWVDFSAQLMKAKAVIHDTTLSTDEAMGKLRVTVQRLSIETGESMDKLVSAFYRFGTVGLSFEESVRGMQAALKAGMAMFGNVDQYARVLALSYKLLGDTIDKNIPPQDRMMSISAKLYTLWQKNAFEMDDFTQSLQKFLPTANTMNLTLDETLILLSTLSTGALQGARGGTLLRTSFSKLVESIDDVATSLGLLVDLRTETTFDVLMRVVDKLSGMLKAGDMERASEALREIFGGVRGGEPIRALIAMRDVLKENATLIAQGRYDEIMKKFKDRTEEVTDELSRQTQILDNLRRQIGMTFVQAVFGGDSFADSLKNVNEFLKEANVRVKTFYDTWVAIMSLGVVPLINAMAGQVSKMGALSLKVSKGLGGELSPEEIDSLIRELEDLSKLPFAQAFKVEPVIMQNLDLILDRLRKIREEKERISGMKYTAGGMREPFEPQLPQVPPRIKIPVETELKLEELKEALKYRQLELQGVSDVQIAEQKLTDYIAKRVEKYNELEPAEGKVKELLSGQQILSLAMSGNYEEILNLTNKRIIDEKEILEIQRLINALEEERIKSIKEYSDILGTSIKSAILAWEKGEATLLSGIQKVGNTIRESILGTVAEGFTTQIMRSTGIGQMFGVFGVNLKRMISGEGGIGGGIKDGFDYGADLTYNSIVRGFRDATTGGGLATAGWTGGGGGGWTLPGFGVGGYFTQPIGGNYQYLQAAVGGGYKSGYGKVVKGKWIPYTGVTKGQMAGAVGMSALTGYSAYQSAGGGGAGVGAGITSGLGALALTGAMMGFGGAAATATAAAGALVAMPWLLPVLGIALLLGSQFFGGKRTQTSVEVKTTENAISSRIDVTNKQLEIVNRNLIALRTDIRTYILPSSAYFSEKRGLVDEFSIMSRSGYLG